MSSVWAGARETTGRTREGTLACTGMRVWIQGLLPSNDCNHRRGRTWGERRRGVQGRVEEATI